MKRRLGFKSGNNSIKKGCALANICWQIHNEITRMNSTHTLTNHMHVIDEQKKDRKEFENSQNTEHQITRV